MLFNSFDFLAFLIIILIFKEVVPKKLSSLFLCLLGIYFYAYWSWFYATLLLATVLFDWILGLIIGLTKNPLRKKIFLFISLGISLSVLGVFKYGDFVDETFHRLFGFGETSGSRILKELVLPVGISFYTFQSMAYVIDVYRGYKPVLKLIEYASYVTFFPQLVAGPIERASHLLPQLKSVLCTERREWGVISQLILWGLFKKIVIADNLAPFVDRVFHGNNLSFSTWEAVGGAIAFSIQIYGDFSGYTDIARGVAKIFGVDLTLNFDSPYKANSIQDFWRRWHISLSTWIRDYLYIPLGGSRSGSCQNYFNLLFTMMIAGLWHGASWMFVIWGAYHGLWLVLERCFTNHGYQSPWNYLPPIIREGAVYVVVCFGWVLFRCQSFENFYYWTRALLTPSIYPDQSSSILLVVGMGLLMWMGGRINNFFKNGMRSYSLTSAAWIAALILGLCLFSSQNNRDFIYFQF